MDAGLGFSNRPGGLSLLGNQDNKFKIIEAETSIGHKTSIKTKRPTKTYFDIEFKKDGDPSYFSYLIFQNYFCH